MSKSAYLRRLACSLALTLGLLAAGGMALRAGATPVKAPKDPAAAVALTTPGKLVVAVAPEFAEADLRAMLARQGATLERWLPHLGLALIAMPVGDERAVAEGLDAEPAVDFVAPHRKLARIADVPLDQYWGQQWGPAKVQGPAAWDLAWADPSIIIADVDTGILQEHFDLRDRTWRNPGESGIDPATGQRTCAAPIAYNGIDDDENGYIDDCRGWDFVMDDNNPDDGQGHGTVIAGIAAASTDNPSPQAPGVYEGIAGMARQASLMAVRVLDSGGTGYAFDIAAGIDYAAANGARVINLSLTFPPTTPPDSFDVAMLRRAVEAAQAAGVLLVGASGNDNYNGVSYPAKFPGVLAVGASNQTDARASFSNYGNRLDLVAPGDGIFSTLYRPGLNNYGLFKGEGKGTSFAAPHVSGAAALVRGLRPDLGQAAVYELIRRTADDVGAPGFDPQTGWGRLNAFRAVSEAITGLNLGLVADPPSVALGGQTPVYLRIIAPAGTTAGLGARVTLIASRGSITPTRLTADSTGRASALFTAGSVMGTAHVTATLGGVSVTLPVTITSGTPAGLVLSAAPAVIPSGGGQATVTATVRDEGGSAVSDGVHVSFAATLGAVNPVTATTHLGKATTVFTAGALGGQAEVRASVAGFTATVPVTILGAGEPYTITLAAVPPQLQVGGAPGVVTADVTDAFGARVADGTPVHFATDRGALSSEQAATAGGRASVQLTPGALAGDAHVTAQAGAARGELRVPIVSGQAYTVSLAADPPALVAGYNQVSVLSARAWDRYGNPVADGTALAFAASLGHMASPAAPTAGGVATAQFIGGLVAGTSWITVTAPGGAQAFTHVAIGPAAPGQVTLQTNPGEITVGGETSRLRAIVQDSYGNRVADGTPVTFTTDQGDLRPVMLAGAGTAQGGELVISTISGVAEANLVSGQKSGTAHVRATVGPGLSQNGAVVISPGPASQLILAAAPPQVAVGGRVDLSAQVQDRYGNMVADGTVVTFAANHGQIHQTLVPTAAGYAFTWLTAPDQPGAVTVFAGTGAASNFVTVDVTSSPPLRKAFLPLILRQ